MDDLFEISGMFFLLHLLSFGMYVLFNDRKFAYDKKIEKEIEKEIENIFGRCRLIKYLLPFISTLIIFFLLVVFFELINFYDEGLWQSNKFALLFCFVIIFLLYSSIVYGWCWVGKCIKNVFGRRGLIIYCVISIILAIIAYIPIIAIIAYSISDS